MKPARTRAKASPASEKQIATMPTLLMAGSEAPTYYPNPYFWTKMTLLLLVGVHALVFKPTVYDHPEELDKSPVLPTRAKVAAVLSLILWVSIPVCGRLIGYYEPDEGKAPHTVTNR